MSKEARLTVDLIDEAHERRFNWRPLYLRPWFFSGVLLLEIGLAISATYLLMLYQQRQNPVLFTFRWDLSDLTVTQYFIWRELLAIVVTGYQCVNSLIDHHVLQMAPFYKLATPQGLSRKDALYRDATSHFEYLMKPHRAGALVWLSSFATASLYVAQVVQATVFHATNEPDVDLQGTDYFEEAAHHVGRVVVSIGGAVGLIVILWLIPIGHLCIFVLLLKKKSGLAQDPRSVEGALTLLGARNALNPWYRMRLWNGKFVAGEKAEQHDIQRDEGWGRRIRIWLYCTVAYSLFLTAFNGAAPETRVAWTLRRYQWLPSLLFVLFQSLVSKCNAAIRLVESPSNIDFTGTLSIVLWIKAIQHRRPIMTLVSLGSLLVPVLGVSITTASEISGYTFINRRTYQDPNEPGYAGQVTEIDWAGNRSTGMLYEAAWIISIAATILIGISFSSALFRPWRWSYIDYDPAWLQSTLSGVRAQL